jgi:hypothetical protein
MVQLLPDMRLQPQDLGDRDNALGEPKQSCQRPFMFGRDQPQHVAVVQKLKGLIGRYQRASEREADGINIGLDQPRTQCGASKLGNKVIAKLKRYFILRVSRASCILHPSPMRLLGSACQRAELLLPGTRVVFLVVNQFAVRESRY